MKDYVCVDGPAKGTHLPKTMDGGDQAIVVLHGKHYVYDLKSDGTASYSHEEMDDE